MARLFFIWECFDIKYTKKCTEKKIAPPIREERFFCLIIMQVILFWKNLTADAVHRAEIVGQRRDLSLPIHAAGGGFFDQSFIIMDSIIESKTACKIIGVKAVAH